MFRQEKNSYRKTQERHSWIFKMEEKIKRMIEKNPLAFATIDKSGKLG